MAPRISPAPPAAAEAKVVEEKRMTSRINLEAALSTEEGSDGKAGSIGPKTIRLKRPGDASTIKAVPRPKMVKPAEDAGSAVMNRTARLEVPEEKAEDAEGTEGASPTRRKTIRIKRPTHGPGEDAPIVIARAEAAAAAQGEEMDGMPFSLDDEPNPAFPILAIAAVLVILVTIYLFTVQVFPAWNLSWPGKIIAMQ
jgi:hypothetical protein